MSDLYPAMLRLTGLTCVVVGGGAVAARKIRRLLRSGARVKLISPEASPELEPFLEDASLIYERRVYRPGDLAGSRLAIAATSSREVNAAVAREAHTVGIPVNIADDPDGSTLQAPAAVERDDVTIAISTSGRSPAFARRLREEVELLLTPERLALLELYTELRSSLSEHGTRADASAWADVDQQALDLLKAGRKAEARQILRQQVLAGTGPGV